VFSTAMVASEVDSSHIVTVKSERRLQVRFWEHRQQDVVYTNGRSSKFFTPSKIGYDSHDFLKLISLTKCDIETFEASTTRLLIMQAKMLDYILKSLPKSKNRESLLSVLNQHLSINLEQRDSTTIWTSYCFNNQNPIFSSYWEFKQHRNILDKDLTTLAIKCYCHQIKSTKMKMRVRTI